jgi:hypothetical protein
VTKSFFAYAEWLELEFFFSGYLLCYALVIMLKTFTPKQASIKNIAFNYLPNAYALAGTLYAGLLLRNLYPDYSITHVLSSVHAPLFKIWGLLALLFWLRPFRKHSFTIIHSLLFFLLMLNDIAVQVWSNTPDSNLRDNDIKIYMGSFFLHLAALGLVILFMVLKIKFGSLPQTYMGKEAN